MNMNEKEQVLQATLEAMWREKKEMFSSYVADDHMRRFLAQAIHEKGYTVVNDVEKKRLYVALQRRRTVEEMTHQVVEHEFQKDMQYIRILLQTIRTLTQNQREDLSEAPYDDDAVLLGYLLNQKIESLRK